MKKFIVILFLLFLSTSSNADVHTFKIERVGCHINSNMCFAYVDGPITSSCPSNDRSFRWDVTGPNGGSALSILLAAQAAGKRVTFDESGCYSNYPSFAFLIILDN